MQLDHILNGIAELGERPPLSDWQPEPSGEMDLVIARDGRWIHEGSPIQRPELVRLFARILRREDDGHHYLVTPIEKWRISVEDTAFVVLEAELADEQREGQSKGQPEDHVDKRWWLTTNVGERIALGQEYRLSLSTTPAGEEVPQVCLPYGVSARLGRNVFYRLVEQAEARSDCGELGLTSDGVWQPLGRLEGDAH
ncbi:DUF1285 domain-containing protein [Halomonas sp. DP5N14-9]|uniref:DUF1285 domain-containing protein n=1 Tax=Halomonas sp. DP5N14-9 TaxID=2859075 RepID=UPI001C99B3FF|nr:DUF1285 domain-containing protein [Halomonas sp. DP5N14-9]MBY5942005.1 DUF1285 domain-containing protein [Halomonas sp. DP5N14-9]